MSTISQGLPHPHGGGKTAGIDRVRTVTSLSAVTLCILISCLARDKHIPQIDIIGAMVIVWRVKEKIIRSVLCNIERNNCAQCNAHTYERTLQLSGFGFVSLGPFHCA